MPVSLIATNSHRSPSSRRGRPRQKGTHSTSPERGSKASKNTDSTSEELEMSAGAVSNNRFSALAPKVSAPGVQAESSAPPRSKFTFRCQRSPTTIIRIDPPSISPEASILSKKSNDKVLAPQSVKAATSSAPTNDMKEMLPKPEVNEDLSLVHKDRKDNVLAPPSTAFSCAKDLSIPPAPPLRPTSSKADLSAARPIMGSNSSTSGLSILGLQTSSTHKTPPSSPPVRMDSSNTPTISPETQRQKDSQPLHPSFPTSTAIQQATVPKGAPQRRTTPYPALTKYVPTTEITVAPLAAEQTGAANPSGNALVLEDKTSSWSIFGTSAETTAVDQAASKKVMISPVSSPSKFRSPAVKFGRKRSPIARESSEARGGERKGDRGRFGGKRGGSGDDESDGDDDGDGDREEGDWEWVGKVSV